MGASQSKNYQIIRELGKGTYGTVYLVKDKTTEEIYALKKVQLKTKEQKEKALREAKLLSDCSHPNIVRAISFYQESHFFSSEMGLIMEYCNEGDLVALINARRKNRLGLFPEKEILLMIGQIAEGLAYLHHRKIIHRDLKIDNILIKDHVLKIADVGVSRILSDHIEKTQTITGTPLYMAPEILKGSYSFAVDIFAFGCLLKELMILDRIEEYTVEDISLSYSKGLRLLCQKMFDLNPEGRPSIDEVRELIQELSKPPPMKSKEKEEKGDLLHPFPLFLGSLFLGCFLYVALRWMF